MAIEKLNLLKELASRELTGPFILDAAEIIQYAAAHPLDVINFRLPFTTDVRSLNAGQYAGQSNTKIFDVESPFSTGKATDVVFASVNRWNICGASLTKPERPTLNADMVHVMGDILIVADGSSMVAKPGVSPDFPQGIVEKCTHQGLFTPDVLWTTALSVLVGKTNFKSPFLDDINTFFDKTTELQDFSRQIGEERNPAKIISIVNEAMGFFLTRYFNVELNPSTKLFLPSGVIGVVNLATRRWASVGDIRVGYTANYHGGVKTVNNFQKVDRFDNAVKASPQSVKEFYARARTEEVGNLQGLNITIETGRLPEIVPSKRTNGKGAVLMWTDGADHQYVSGGQKNSFLGSARDTYDKKVSFTGTLMARDPFIYIPYLLHSQNLYAARLEAELNYLQRTNHEPPFLRDIRNHPLWRADEGSLVVAYG